MSMGGSYPRRRTPMCSACRIGATNASRKRRRSCDVSARRRMCLLLACLSQQRLLATHAAVVTWSNGPEDTFFCGTSWDEGNCATRQNCRSGRDDECEGHDTHGIRCFANTECDTKKGGMAAWVSGMYLEMSPSVSPVEAVDFDALVEGGLFTPTSSPHTPGDPTGHPTDMPIEPPPPFDYPSLTASDHWFCGIGIDDANNRCEVHCPNSNECPHGEICYFGTSCDSRTHAPTPPPTRGPTGAPTTAEPTVSNPPTLHPTISWPPTISPTLPLPTTSPVKSPTKRPTYSPLTEIQGGMFCGVDWQDVTSSCKKRCPSGEDPECPGTESCFAFTGCKRENGYGSDPSKWVPGYDEWGNLLSEVVAGMPGSEAATFADNVAEAVEDDEPLCKDAEVTITADNWPQEVTWKITDQDTGNDVVTGNSEELVANEPVSKTICLPSWGCYLFTIYDAGGDGLCCEHGNGLYQVKYDGDVVVNGAAFYDSESAEFGCKTDAPTKRPTKQEQEIGSDSDTQYRCVANPLVSAGYVVSEGLCDKFVDCFNQYIEMGDDFFCGEGESCVLAEACGGIKGGPPPSDATEASEKQFAIEEREEGEEPPAKEEEESEEESPAKEDTATRPRPAPAASTPRPSKEPTKRPTPKPVTLSPTAKPTTMAPSTSPTTSTPTESPTEIPTDAPTLGPCGGDPCPLTSQCRSRYGFCGPGENYCDATAIWTIDCPPSQPLTPRTSPPTPPPSMEPVKWSALDVFPSPSASSAKVPAPDVAFQKPSGGGKPKPTGGKKPSGANPPSGSQPMTPEADEPAPYPTPKPVRAADELVSFEILSPSLASLEEAGIGASDATNRPTPRPAKAAGGTAASSDSGAASRDDENAHSCTGEPCEVETWCRSRYGSCGPGFIYCNTKSTWESSCPSVQPGTRPMKRPSPRPTRPPAKGFVASEPGAPTAVQEPTFPPLAGPTLPYISSGGQTYLAFQGSRPSAEKDDADDDSKDSSADEDGKVEEEEGAAEETGESSKTEPEASYTGLDQWIEFTEGLKNGADTHKRSMAGNALAVSFVLSLILC